MTQKELLYVEDAIMHERIIISICDFMIESLEDDDLITFIEKENKKHNTMLEKLEYLLKEKANE